MITNNPDGFYAVYVAGTDGNGLVLLILSEGKIAGADLLGVIFDGEYSRTHGEEYYRTSIRVKAPPSATLVQGVTTGPSGIEYEISADLPLDFEAQPYVEILTPLGKLNARFKKLRGLVVD